jgi:hypothetical protein
MDMQVGRQYRTGKKGKKADGHAGGQAGGEKAEGHAGGQAV